MPPIEAVDALMQAQEAIRTIYVRHGLKATLTSKPVFNGPQNGCHMHLSMNTANNADSFLAGILQKMTALCAFGMPNFDSYVRVTDDGAGLWIGFGTENRDLPIRKITEEHWELPFADSTANFYLFIAAVLAAGSAGISQARHLVWKDCSVSIEKFNDVELATYGIVERMPHSLRLSLDKVKCDKGIEGWVGRDMFTQCLDVKEK
jgi:glutamine synthetase